MTKKLETLLRSLKRIQLNTTERAQMRENIYAFMEKHPAGQKPSIFRFLYLSRRPITMLATLAIVVTTVLGAGVSYAAESSLPGDPLYTVKVHFNEKVLAKIKFKDSDEEQIKAHIWKMDRRENEYQKLEALGMLDEEKERVIKSNVEKQELKMNEFVTKIGGEEKLDEESKRKLMELREQQHLRQQKRLEMQQLIEANPMPTLTSSGQVIETPIIPLFPPRF